MIQPTRVLYVMSDLLEGQGGIQSMVMAIFEHINRQKVQLDFVVHVDGEPSFIPTVKAQGSHVYQAPQFKKVGPLAYIRWWNRFFKEHPQYKIVHGHMLAYLTLYLLIAKLHGRITIAHSHSACSPKTRIQKYIEKIAFFPLRWVADYHFACSVLAGQYLYGNHITQQSSFRFIPNARDIQQFAYNPAVRQQLRQQLGLNNHFVLGYVGRLAKGKNLFLLLDIFAEIYKKDTSARLLLVGDGPFKDPLLQHTRALQLEHAVLFAGLVPNPQDYYQVMDVFVLPSFSEGLGMVLTEAQISGLPCLMAAHLPSEVDLECGLLYKVPLSQPASVWAEKIQTLPPRLRRTYSEPAAQKGFEITALVKQLEDFYMTVGTEVSAKKGTKSAGE